MAPEIEAIKALGITALVECSTGGVGVRADLDLAVSQATDFPIVVPTGNYREPWIPDWVRDASEAELAGLDAARAQRRLRRRRAFRPAGSSSAPATTASRRSKQNPARRGASRRRETNAVIGSHTIKGRVVMDQLDIIEAEGGCAEPVHLDPHPGGAGLRHAHGGGRARRLDRVRPCRPRRRRRGCRHDPAGARGRARPRNCCSATIAAGTIRRCPAAACQRPTPTCRCHCCPSSASAASTKRPSPC